MSTTPLSDSTTVEISAGRLHGVSGRVRAFKGIPYAQAPLGALRWTPPRPHAGWTGILDATDFGNDCTQRPLSILRGRGMSEDCLFLNVWTPARQGERLPVMVWIHGDGYTRGSGSIPVYDGEALAEQGVVLVTINYRLGLAGFLAHVELTQESPQSSSGNYGLLDQIAALSWVKRNIAVFGGDPDRITVFGQSAGATCTNLLMASPLAEGLIDQAILHSPGSMRPMASLHEAEESGARIGSDVETLRRIPIMELVEMQDVVIPPVRKLASPRGLGPIVDGWIVRGDDVSNYSNGATRPIPTIVGSASLEGRRLGERFPIKTPSDLKSYTDGSFGADVVLPNSYRADRDAEVAAALERVIGDTQFNYGTWSTVRRMRKLGAPVYQYLFTQPDAQTGVLPTHDDELPYAFGTLQRGGLRPKVHPAERYQQQDYELSQLMTATWARFAKTGSPHAEDALPWPRSDEGGRVRIFGPGEGEARMPRTSDLEFLQKYFGHPDPS